MLQKLDNRTHGLLDDCLSLEVINLSRNKFDFVRKKMFPHNPYIPYKLYEVDLSYNEIPVVTHEMTYGLKKLKKLDLSGNIINDIRNNVLGNLTDLQFLNISRNQLENLISKNPDSVLALPSNITEIDMSFNQLVVLPVEKIVKARKLRVLDVRNNRLTDFEPVLVKEIVSNGLDVYFDGNDLKCDCFTRPLKHYMDKLKRSVLEKDAKYFNLVCKQPPSLFNESLKDLHEDKLICPSNVEVNSKMEEYSDDEMSFDFISVPDVVFRDIQ